MYKRNSETYPLLDALAVAVAVDRVQGFVKSGQGFYIQETEQRVDDNRQTALNVLRRLGGKNTQTEGMDLDRFLPTKDDQQQAIEIWKHFDEILVMDKLADDLVKTGRDGRINDFNYQMSRIFEANVVDANKDLAMIVSLPNSRRISAKRSSMEKFYSANRDNGYIGELRSRTKISGRVIDVKYIPRHNIHLATVYTTENKLAKFFMNDKQNDMSKRIVDTDVTFVGTVKKQSVNEFTQCQETMFNRIKFQIDED